MATTKGAAVPSASSRPEVNDPWRAPSAQPIAYHCRTQDGG